ncbi:hypothetical protein HDU97_009306, partial [Phlyctochytrium planicorne]
KSENDDDDELENDLMARLHYGAYQTGDDEEYLESESQVEEENEDEGEDREEEEQAEVEEMEEGEEQEGGEEPEGESTKEAKVDSEEDAPESGEISSTSETPKLSEDPGPMDIEEAFRIRLEKRGLIESPKRPPSRNEAGTASPARNVAANSSPKKEYEGRGSGGGAYKYSVVSFAKTGTPASQIKRYCYNCGFEDCKKGGVSYVQRRTTAFNYPVTASAYKSKDERFDRYDRYERGDHYSYDYGRGGGGDAGGGHSYKRSRTRSNDYYY